MIEEVFLIVPQVRAIGGADGIHIPRLEVVLQVNGKALAGNTAAQPFEVLPGDTITVAESVF